MAAVHAAHRDRLPGRVVAQLRIQPPLVGLLVLQRGGRVHGQQPVQVAGQGLEVGGVVDGQVTDPVACRAQLCGKAPHRREDRQDLLRVVQHVVGFLAHLHQHIHHLRIHLLEPAVLGVELVAQQQAQGVGGGRGGAAHAVPHRRW